MKDGFVRMECCKFWQPDTDDPPCSSKSRHIVLVEDTYFEAISDARCPALLHDADQMHVCS